MLCWEIVLASVSEPLLNWISQCGPSLIFNLTENTLNLRVYGSFTFSWIVFINAEIWTFKLNLLRMLIMNMFWSYCIFLCPLFDDLIIFTASTVNILVPIHWFDSLEASLQSRDKSHLEKCLLPFCWIENGRTYLSEYIFIHWEATHFPFKILFSLLVFLCVFFSF